MGQILVAKVVATLLQKSQAHAPYLQNKQEKPENNA